MHVGVACDYCPDLFVDNWELKRTKDYFTGIETFIDEEKGQVKLDTIENDKYLGDIISFDGKNKKNILARRNKGIAIIKQMHSLP